MIRIGVVNIDVSHPITFSNYLRQGDRARYVAVYNDSFRDDDEVEAFISNHGLERRCRTIEELADFVDIGFVQSCNWENHIEQAMPFIERGKPVFIDKPIVGSPADCARLEELSAKGAVILGSSSVRYCYEIADFLAKPVEEVGRIVNVFATVGTDEFNYAVHAVEIIGGLLGAGARSCKFVGRGAVDGGVCETFYVSYSSGATAVYNTLIGPWQPFDVEIMTTKSTFRFRVDTTKIYCALLDRICDFMETGRNTLAPVSALTESIRIMLAGRISRGRGGAEIELSDIPMTDPGFGGTKFAQEYALNAMKIYQG